MIGKMKMRDHYYDIRDCIDYLELLDDAHAVNDDEVYRQHYITIKIKLKKIMRECSGL